LPVTFKRSVFRSGNSYRMTIPMPIINALGIKEKDVLEIWLDDAQIIARKREKA
jgi:bifunctional DNA-binding transcriptional regulator/antitoxin component of YhaV-PrlF toxin-antitoxin module